MKNKATERIRACMNDNCESRVWCHQPERHWPVCGQSAVGGRCVMPRDHDGECGQVGIRT